MFTPLIPYSAGKSSLVLAQQAKWRCMYLLFPSLCLISQIEFIFAAHGLWGQAKFQELESAPFASLVRRILVEEYLSLFTTIPSRSWLVSPLSYDS